MVAPAFGTGQSATARPAISRPELFATLFLLAALNGMADEIVTLIRSQGLWPAAAGTFGLSIVTLAALWLGLRLALRAPALAPRRGDWIVAAFALLPLLVPHRLGGWAAMTGLALYSLGRDRHSPFSAAAASIFLALAASEFWASVLVQIFAAHLLAWDAALAAGMLSLLGAEATQSGNLILTGDHRTLVVLVGCASLPNMAYGILCWMVVARALRPAWRWADLPAGLAVAGVAVAANAIRLALMGLSAGSYDRVHGVVGANVFNVVLLLVTVAIALLATRPVARGGPAARGHEPVRQNP